MKSNLLLFAGLGMMTLSAGAQQLKTDYISWPVSNDFPKYVKLWEPGQALFEDENFFISRVKPKAYIERNTALQVDPTLTDDNDKRLVFWVPLGNTNLNGVHTNTLPNSIFDSEVFSAWSYVTHFGNWTSPHGWVPGGFADAAHKHGTAVSGVASVPYGSLSSSWATTLGDQVNLDNEKVAKFLYYHGVDGMGYNSEFNTSNSTMLQNLRAQHDFIYNWMAERNPKYENIWYDGTNDNGSISFDQGLGSHNDDTFGDGEHKRASLFLNYNWNRENTINNSITNAASLGRSTLDLYAGHNMQGGEPKNAWNLLAQTPYSIGLWGAHDFNYIWSTRSSEGSSYDQKQDTYQKHLEQWFTNGLRNPANTMEITEGGSMGPRDDFFGMSRLMSARSSLGWDLTDEPFITYFNLGNGKFFNLEGEQQNDRSWFSLGIQDYMPTWRWWFASSFLGRTPDAVPATGLEANFTWNDARFGGSCLNIKGSTADEYLHLFRTQFLLQSNDVITVRYKVLSGKGNVNLAISKKGDETKLIRENNLKVLTVNDETDSDEWIEKTFTVKAQLSSLNKATLAMIALHFTDAENLDILLGEISIKRGTYTAPVAPVITSSKALAYNYRGADMKVIFNVPNNKAADEPCYNSDVFASMFRVYTQQEGEEPVLMGATTSWAHIVYQAPVNLEGTPKMRVGVQSVGLDNTTTSEIVWGEYVDLPGYVTDNNVQINKTSIKPNESFEVSFIDPKHEATTWQLFNTAGEKLAEQEGTALVMENGVPEVGGYDVVVFPGTDNERRYAWLVQVSDFDKGALPEIQTLTVDGAEADADVAIALNDQLTLGYTGRNADGGSSRGIAVNQGFVGAPIGTGTAADGSKVEGLDIQPLTSFGAAAWLKLDLPQGASTSLFQIENRAGSWPANNWGWCWFGLEPDGKISIRFRGGHNGEPELGYYYSDAYVTPSTWTHVAFSFEYENSLFLFRLFINGVEKDCYLYGKADGGGALPTLEGPAKPIDTLNPVTSGTDWLSFGGGRGSEPVYNDGVVDDMVVFNTAITADDVAKAMKGYEGEIPANVLAYWSFENDPTDHNTFIAQGASQAEGSQFGLQAGSNEGQSFQTPQTPIIESGCPFIAGSSYKITTLPTWSGRKVRVAEAEGNDVAGQAKVSFAAEGDYTVTLTLENVLGKDVKTYPVIKAGSGINDIAADGTISAYTVDDAVLVDFAEAGAYTVTVYDLAGNTVAQKAANVNGGEVMTIGVNADGIYLVKVVKEGTVLRTFKLLKR